MAKSHIKSDLLISKAPIPIDNNTTLLCHYDISTISSNGLSPIADISQITGMNQKIVPNGSGGSTAAYDGKFGGAVSICEATTNIWNKPFNLLYPRDSALISSAGTYSIPISTHGTYTLSLWTRLFTDDTATNPRVTFRAAYSDGTFTTSQSAAILKDDMWRFVSLTVTTDTAKTLTALSGWIFDYSTPGAARHCEAASIQVEALPYSTYFTSSTRADSYITYPSYILNKNEGTISVWFASTYDLRAMTSGTGRGQGDRCIFYTEHGWSTNQGFLIYLNDGNQPYAIMNGATITDTTKSWKAYEWHMATFSWSSSGNYFKLYIDGNPVGSPGTFQTAWTVGNLRLGMVTSNFLIDELRVDSVAKTDEEILSWYISQCPFYAKERYKVVR